MNQITLESTVYHRLMKLLKSDSMNELVCLLFGTCSDLLVYVTNLVQMENLDQSPVSFSLDYEVMYNEIQAHEEIGQILVGFFHSHPEGANPYPSMKDHYFMKNWPYPYVWLIGLSGSEPILSFFTLLQGRIVELPYIVRELDPGSKKHLE